jgi:K+ transporter
MMAQSTFEKLLDDGLSGVLVVLSFAAGAVALLAVAAVVFLLLLRWHDRPYKLRRQTKAELDALRTRLDRLEGGGGSADAVQALEDRIVFLESLLTDGTDAAKPLPGADPRRAAG